MRVIQPTQFSCMACCVAMITGDPLERVFRFLRHDGSKEPFRFLDCAAYLNRRGFHLGASGVCSGVHFSDRRQPALLIVAKSVGQGNHAVYWTGQEVHDPNPASEGKRLMEYQIREWWPITRYED